MWSDWRTLNRVQCSGASTAGELPASMQHLKLGCSDQQEWCKGIFLLRPGPFPPGPSMLCTDNSCSFLYSHVHMAQGLAGRLISEAPGHWAQVLIANGNYPL